MKKINVALLGFGTVGKGTYRALTINKERIKKVAGVEVEVTKILEKNPKAIESGIAPKNLFTQDINDILNDKDISIVAEILGGKEPATTFMLDSMKNGKSVVTPNKAVIAADYEKFKAAEKENNVFFRYEASVCGAIPVIAAINNSLVANKITKIKGIVNGTTNYILTKMGSDGLAYDVALKKAQELGFAEADPTADVEGIDAANKLSILMAEAFGVHIKPTEIDRRGITSVSIEDIKNAEKKGCKIKLIAGAEIDENGNIKASVKPTEVPCDSPLGRIDNEFNGVLLSCNMADDIFMTGRGAGQDPTGSAMASDIVAIAKELAK